MMWASGDWLAFCGFERDEVAGKTLKIIQGPETDADTVAALMDAVRRMDTINVTLTNYTRHGSACRKFDSNRDGSPAPLATRPPTRARVCPAPMRGAVAVPFRHDVEVQPLTNSHGDAVIYRVTSTNVTTLVEQGVVTNILPMEVPRPLSSCA